MDITEAFCVLIKIKGSFRVELLLLLYFPAAAEVVWPVSALGEPVRKG